MASRNPEGSTSTPDLVSLGWHQHQWSDPSKARYVSKVHFEKVSEDEWIGRSGDPTLDTWDVGPACLKCGVVQRYVCSIPQP